MAIFRVKKNENYTVMANYHLRDKNLSLKTIGLLSIMLSLPNDWAFSTKGLVSICKDGIDSVRAALQEMEKYGYLVRERDRDEQGRLTRCIYTVYECPHKVKQDKSGTPKADLPVLDNPILDNPMQEKPEQGFPDKGNQRQQSKDKQNTEQPITEEQSTTCFLTSRERGKSKIRLDIHQKVMELLGRALLPQERMMCSLWLDQHIDPEMILLAVEDNLFRKERFDMKYVKAELDLWKKQGVSDARSARNYILDQHAANVSRMASEIAGKQGSEDLRDKIVLGNPASELQGTRDYMIELYRQRKFDSLMCIANTTHLTEVFDYLPSEILEYIRKKQNVA